VLTGAITITLVLKMPSAHGFTACQCPVPFDDAHGILSSSKVRGAQNQLE
jgi:hypothetical protein